MTTIKHLLLSFKELSHFKHRLPELPHLQIPNECAGCGSEYEGSFRSTLQSYRDVYRRLSDSSSRQVEVRIVAVT